MNKLILESDGNTIHFDFSEIESPDDAVHILATALVHLAKEYKCAKDKEDFLRIMELYYDDTE